jgi:hypothetical protein
VVFSGVSGLKPGRYRAEVNTMKVNGHFDIQSASKFLSVKYVLDDELHHKAGTTLIRYPAGLNLSEEATDGTYLHLTVDAQNIGDLSLVLHKVDY